MKKYSNKLIIDSLGIPMITDFEDLVKELRLSSNLVYWLASDAKERYEVFKVKKKDNSDRIIAAPVLSLKIVQRWILENILYKIKTSPYSFGFAKGEKSPLALCAEKHKNNLYVLKMDIRNFYPSISREKIYYIFSEIGYNTEISNLLTNVCTYNNSLPQGAVTSPYISNLVLRKLDFRIAGYCNKRDIVYTRYADDMIFSSDNRDVLKKIYGMIRKIVEDEGFVLNDKKTLFMTPKGHKKVLGLTINNGIIKVSREMKRSLRALIHYQIATSDYSFNQQIRGYISYINSIESGYRKKTVDYINKLATSPLCLFPELVKAFNENKLYKDIPDMKEKESTDFVDYKDKDVFEGMIYSEHEEFLKTHGMIKS